MNNGEIEKLLEKYFEGLTTLAEEAQLRAFFSDKAVPETLKRYQPLFQYFESEIDLQIGNDSFDRTMDVKLIESSPFTSLRVLSHRKRLLYISSIAAGILLVIGLFFTLRYEFSGKSRIPDRPSPEEQAYQEASEALYLLSANFNIGLKGLDHLQLLETGFEQAAKFGKFYQYQTLIINPDDLTNQSNKSLKQ